MSLWKRLALALFDSLFLTLGWWLCGWLGGVIGLGSFGPEGPALGDVALLTALGSWTARSSFNVLK
jgi:hypothetical protein